ARFFTGDPAGSPQGSTCKDRPVVRPVGELDRLEVFREHDRMIPNNIPSTDHVDADLITPLHHALAAIELLPGSDFLVKDLQDGLCRPARGILLVPVVRLDHFDVIIPEQCSCLPYQLPEDVDADREVARYHCRDMPVDCFCHDLALFRCKSRRSYYEGHVVFCCDFDVLNCRMCDSEIDQHIGFFTF